MKTKSMNYWLMKSEPEVFSIADLKRVKKTWWDGVRNYQARNYMRDQMKVGDKVLFYHSNAEPSGVAGVATVSAPSAPDQTAFDKKSEYFDPKATKENPIWECVQVQFVEVFPHFVGLDEIRQHKSLGQMVLLQKGSRLSVQPVQKSEFDKIVSLGRGAHE